MNPIKAVIDFFQTLPEQTARLDRFIDKVDAIIRDARIVADALHAQLRQQIDPTFVYLLPPAGSPMFCHRAYVKRGETYSVSFDTQMEIPEGVWVVTGGPAVVRGVIIGNQWQLASNDFQGQVCKTVEKWLPGCKLRVELAA